MVNINWPIDITNRHLRVLAMQMTDAVTLGWIPGYDIGIRSGERLDLSKVAYQDIDSGYSTEPTTPGGARVVSSSADDTLTGIGVQKVKCVYLDSDWNLKSEIVAMNGTTPVALEATDILHIDEFYSVQLGSNRVAVGNIDWQSPTGSVTYARIPIGINVWLCARAHVPVNREIVIRQWSVAVYDGAAKFLLRAENDLTSEGGGTSVPLVQDMLSATNGFADCILQIPIRITEKSHVWVSAKGKGPNPDATATFRYGIRTLF